MTSQNTPGWPSSVTYDVTGTWKSFGSLKKSWKFVREAWLASGCLSWLEVIFSDGKGNSTIRFGLKFCVRWCIASHMKVQVTFEVTDHGWPRMTYFDVEPSPGYFGALISNLSSILHHSESFRYIWFSQKDIIRCVFCLSRIWPDVTCTIYRK